MSHWELRMEPLDLEDADVLVSLLTGVAGLFAILKTPWRKLWNWSMAYVTMPTAFLEMQVEFRRSMTQLHDHMSSMEHALVVADARHKAIIAGTDLAYWESDTKGSFDYVSPGFARIVGRNIHELLEFGWESMVDVRDRERVSHGYAKAVATGSYFTETYRVVRDNAGTPEVIWLRVQATPGIGKTGQPQIYMGSAVKIEPPAEL